MKAVEQGVVISQQEISPGIFDLWIEAPQITAAARAGQFVNVFTDDAAKLLPRPVSICRVDREAYALRLVYRVSGENTGTARFSEKVRGDSLRIMGPLGNGFPIEEIAGKHVFLVGGGIGIPPMLETARAAVEAGAKPELILGYRDDCFLADEFETYGPVHIATEDGSAGIRGTVLDVLLQKQLQADAVFACGPKPMLRALKAYAGAQDLPCWISMEERMACGIGACLACVCESAEEDVHSHVRNKRVCKDGPVFRADELVL